MVALKIMMFLLFLSIVDVVKEAFAFFLAFRTERKLELTLARKILLAVSIAYIFTIIFTGFGL